MPIEPSFDAAACRAPLPLPHTPFSKRAERLLDTASGLMSRGWPLVVTVAYLDCALAILLGRWSTEFGQIVWHLLAIGLTHCLAMMGGHVNGVFRPAIRPRPAHARMEILCGGAVLLPLLLAVAASSCIAAPANPLPLDWLARLVVFLSSLLLCIAILARLSRLRVCFGGSQTEFFAEE